MFFSQKFKSNYKFSEILTIWLINRFDIEGYVTGFGNPDWARTHESATRTSPIILTLVDGGASCVGKTIIDELAYGYKSHTSHPH